MEKFNGWGGIRMGVLSKAMAVYLQVKLDRTAWMNTTGSMGADATFNFRRRSSPWVSTGAGGPLAMDESAIASDSGLGGSPSANFLHALLVVEQNGSVAECTLDYKTGGASWNVPSPR